MEKFIENKKDEVKFINPIKLILLDYHMPKKNGFEVLYVLQNFFERIKVLLIAEGVTIKLPKFVFLTAFISRELK